MTSIDILYNAYNFACRQTLHAGSKEQGDKLDVKEGPEGLYIPGLTIEPVAGMDDVASALKRARSNRSTFATNMNEHSSRSHLVMSIYVQARNLVRPLA